MKLSQNFTLNELTKSQTAVRKKIVNSPSLEAIANLQALVTNVLQPIREHYNLPVNINSGYRSLKLNKLIGGSKTSQHCLGQAADIEIYGLSNKELAIFIRDNLTFDQLILENHDLSNLNSGWIHVSYIASPNRKQSLTFNGKEYSKFL